MNLLKMLLEINKIGKEIENMSDSQELGNFLLKKLKKIIDFDFFALGSIDEETLSVNYLFYEEDGRLTTDISRAIVKEKSLTYYSFINKKIILMNDSEKEYKNYVSSLMHLGTEHTSTSLLIIPLYENDKIIGFLNVQNWKKDSFDAEKVVLFKEIAVYLSSVLIKFRNQRNTNIISGNKANSKSLLGNFVEKSIEVDNIPNLNKLFLEFLNKSFGVREFTLDIYKNSFPKFYSFINEKQESFSLLKEESHKFSERESFFLFYEDRSMGKISFPLGTVQKNETFFLFVNIYKINLIKILEKNQLQEEIEENKNNIFALKKAYENIKYINELGKSIGSINNLKELCFLLHRELKKIFEVNLSIILATLNGERINYIAIENNEEIFLESLNMANEDSLASFCIKNERTIIINDYKEDIEFYFDDKESSLKNTVGEFRDSVIFIPLFDNKKIIGAFSVQCGVLNFFDSYSVELIKNISSFVTMATVNEIKRDSLKKEIELVRLNHSNLQEVNLELEKISSIDSLTTLFNRREFEKQIKEIILENKEKNIDLFLALIDLDYFKHINDNLGHPEGDRYLIEVSKLFKSYENQNIKFARYGGDEFIAYFYGTTKIMVNEIFTDLQNKLKWLSLPNPHSGENQTLTIGITNLYDLEDKNYENLYLKADTALYLGKEKGKNRIEYL